METRFFGMRYTVQTVGFVNCGWLTQILPYWQEILIYIFAKNYNKCPLLVLALLLEKDLEKPP